MVDFTLLRIDVDVESVTADAKAYAPFSKSVGGDAPDDEERSEATVEVEHSGGKSRMKVGLAAALVGLLFLVLAAFLLRRYLTEGEEEPKVETEPVTIE